MPEKEPYKPTEAEIQKAEESMDIRQRLDSENREVVFKRSLRVDDYSAGVYGHPILIKDDKILLHRSEFIGGGKRIPEGYDEISVEMALEKLDKQEKIFEMQIRDIRTLLDRLYSFREQVMELKEKQEKKEK